MDRFCTKFYTLHGLSSNECNDIRSFWLESCITFFCASNNEAPIASVELDS